MLSGSATSSIAERSNCGPGDSSRAMGELSLPERSDSDKSGAPQTSHVSKEGWLWNVQRGQVTRGFDEGLISTASHSFAE